MNDMSCSHFGDMEWNDETSFTTYFHLIPFKKLIIKKKENRKKTLILIYAYLEEEADDP